ncbi:MAG: metal-dependent hydrolase [Haloferacaceae archaeon]
MMATTHALAGLVLAAVVAIVTGDYATLPVVAAALGGLFPDFDLYAGHRKTLHFPVYYSLLAAVAAAVAATTWTPVTAAVALFFAAAALHSVSDMFGGGLELKPWRGTSDRAVYDHFNGRWLAPKRWVRYDGAPEDLAVAMVLAAPSVVAFDGPVELAVFAALGVSAVYVLLRKPMVHIAERLVAALPQTVLGYVPQRFIEDFQ